MEEVIKQSFHILGVSSRHRFYCPDNLCQYEKILIKKVDIAINRMLRMLRILVRGIARSFGLNPGLV